jgi:outer membrane autotransporter protein
VGARYISLDLDGFTETGNIAALTIDSSDVDSLQSIVGLRLGADIPFGAVSLRPEIRGEWRHEFKNDDPRVITGSFGGVGPFGFVTTPLGGDYGVFGAGFSISGGGPLSMIADYTMQFSGGYEIHAVTAGVRMTF